MALTGWEYGPGNINDVVPAAGAATGADWGTWLQMVGGGLLKDWSQSEFGRDPQKTVMVDQWGRPYVEGQPAPAPAGSGLGANSGTLVLLGLGALVLVLVLK